MFLQTSSVINAHSTRAPWRTFEFDACFRTIAPLSNNIEQEEAQDSTSYSILSTDGWKSDTILFLLKVIFLQKKRKSKLIQRTELALKAKPALEEIAKQNTAANLPNSVGPSSNSQLSGLSRSPREHSWW